MLNIVLQDVSDVDVVTILRFATSASFFDNNYKIWSSVLVAPNSPENQHRNILKTYGVDNET